MKKTIRIGLEKARREGLLSLMKDVFVYFPQGKIAEKKEIIETPEGIKLDLSDTYFSAVTKGRIKLGHSEIPERKIISKIPNNHPIIELGAGTGYLTALLNKKTKKTHIAVEANPNLISTIEKTKKLNNSNFLIINKAYHPLKSEIKFPISQDFKSSSIFDEIKDGINVKCINLEELFRAYNLFDCILHVDIEGAEKLLIENEIDIILERCIGLFIEIHPYKIKAKDIKKISEVLSKNFSLIAEEKEKDNIVKLFLRNPKK